eukprot:gene2598-3352_t
MYKFGDRFEEWLPPGVESDRNLGLIICTSYPAIDSAPDYIDNPAWFRKGKGGKNLDMETTTRSCLLGLCAATPKLVSQEQHDELEKTFPLPLTVQSVRDRNPERLPPGWDMKLLLTRTHSRAGTIANAAFEVCYDGIQHKRSEVEAEAVKHINVKEVEAFMRQTKYNTELISRRYEDKYILRALTERKIVVRGLGTKAKKLDRLIEVLKEEDTCKDPANARKKRLSDLAEVYTFDDMTPGSFAIPSELAELVQLKPLYTAIAARKLFGPCDALVAYDSCVEPHESEHVNAFLCQNNVHICAVPERITLEMQSADVHRPAITGDLIVKIMSDAASSGDGSDSSQAASPITFLQCIDLLEIALQTSDPEKLKGLWLFPSASSTVVPINRKLYMAEGDAFEFLKQICPEVTLSDRVCQDTVVCLRGLSNILGITDTTSHPRILAESMGTAHRESPQPQRMSWLHSGESLTKNIKMIAQISKSISVRLNQMAVMCFLQPLA